MVKVRIQPDARLNVLLTEDRQYPNEHWTAQLPRLLEPQGVASYIARTVQEALDLVETMQIHAAVVDLGIPMGEPDRRPPAPGSHGNPGNPGGAPRTPGTHGSVPGRRAPNAGRTTRSAAAGPTGLWLLELLGRLPNHPPIVVVHSPAFDRRQLERIMQEALRLGAFSVLAKPVEIEQILAVFRRLLDRQYHGGWPGTGGSSRGNLD